MATKMTGRAQLVRKLKALAPAVVKAANESLHHGADELVAMQKSLAPVKDGDLQQSITKEQIGPTKLIVKAGGEATTKPVRNGQKATYDYALGIEFGTKKHRNGGLFAGTMNPGTTAQPFFYPSWRALRSRIRSRVTRNMNKAIERTARGG